MKTINGYAAYVDLLGTSHLSKGAISLPDDCVSIYNVPPSFSKDDRHHYIAFKLIAKFRELLKELQTQYPSLEISQFSDCAFLWADNSIVVLAATSQLMFLTIRNGLLCRAGISSGQILLPTNESHQFGKFVAGSAVTNAASNEGKGKGCRIFTDDCYPLQIGDMLKRSVLFNDVFIDTTIPTDFSRLDEIRWFFLGDFDVFEKTLLVEDNEKKKILHNCSELISLLWYSPQFFWNVQNKEGCLHIAATIEAISSGMSKLSGCDGFFIPALTIIDYLNDRSIVKMQCKKSALESDIEETIKSPFLTS